MNLPQHPNKNFKETQQYHNLAFQFFSLSQCCYCGYLLKLLQLREIKILIINPEGEEINLVNSFKAAIDYIDLQPNLSPNITYISSSDRIEVGAKCLCNDYSFQYSDKQNCFVSVYTIYLLHFDGTDWCKQDILYETSDRQSGRIYLYELAVKLKVPIGKGIKATGLDVKSSMTSEVEKQTKSKQKNKDSLTKKQSIWRKKFKCGTEVLSIVDNSYGVRLRVVCADGIHKFELVEYITDYSPDIILLREQVKQISKQLGIPWFFAAFPGTAF